ncbi:MAG: hypothetical protein Q7V58_09565 [Actinomycetota bacterium]|nr:hypothetical protein [Actinomycetota bacterium]
MNTVDAPPTRCTAHLEEPTTFPCGECGDARQEHADWLATARMREADRVRQERDDDLRARRDAIARCVLCDDRGYAGPVVCNHDPEAGPRATRYVKQIKETLGGDSECPTCGRDLNLPSVTCRQGHYGWLCAEAVDRYRGRGG